MRTKEASLSGTCMWARSIPLVSCGLDWIHLSRIVFFLFYGALEDNSWMNSSLRLEDGTESRCRANPVKLATSSGVAKKKMLATGCSRRTNLETMAMVS